MAANGLWEKVCQIPPVLRLHACAPTDIFKQNLMKLWRGRHCPRPVPRPGSTSARFAAWPEASACASTRDLTHLRGPHHPPHSFRLLPGNICGTLLRMHNVVDPWVRSYTHARCLSFSALRGSFSTNGQGTTIFGHRCQMRIDSFKTSASSGRH